jgi:hypothetical protein
VTIRDVLARYGLDVDEFLDAEIGERNASGWDIAGQIVSENVGDLGYIALSAQIRPAVEQMRKVRGPE